MRFFRLLFITFIVSITANAFSQTLEVPVITNVSVDKVSQKPLITWSLTDPSAIDGYIIKRQIFGRAGVVDGSYETVETINDPNQFSYLDISADAILGPAEPGLKSENYRVASFKDVGGGTPQYSLMSEPVATILLSPIAFHLCLEQNTLNWTAYNGFGDNLTGYNIYYSNTLNGTVVQVGQVAADITTFVHEKVEANTTYFYYVEAVDTGGLVANSNIQQITTNMPPLPQVMNADYASVEQDGEVSLSFSLDANAEVNEYLLLKSNTMTGAYDTISSFPSGSGTVTYSDNLSTNEQVAYYKVLAINTCGLPSRETNVANNIVLTTTAKGNPVFTNSLSWNVYEDWSGGVSSYVVYRSVDGDNYEQIATLNSSETSYEDDVSDLVQPDYNGQPSRGHFCYYIEATEGAGNPYGITGVSKSNISCVFQEAVVYLPNAINPKSNFEENRTFKPVASFVNDYQLIVYDRWGEIVFKSTDPLNGWDGKKNGGNLLPKGTYVFYLQYKSRNDELVKTSGQINLVY